MLKRLNKAPVVACVALWALAVVSGLIALSGYEHTPGAVGPAPVLWPEGSRIPRDGRLPALVMVVHPQCPCSRASAEQLDRIMARCGGRVSAHVLAVVPSGAPADFGDGGLTRRLRAVPGVTVLPDEGGREARLFGAETSGHVCLYAPDGRLLFRGGVTGSRGHAGDSAGSDAVVALVNGGGEVWEEARRRTAVFGCPLTGGERANTSDALGGVTEGAGR